MTCVINHTKKINYFKMPLVVISRFTRNYGGLINLLTNNLVNV